MKTYLGGGEDICTVETKPVKNIRLLYRTKALLQENALKSIYFACTHSYLNYANIAWESTYRSKLKTIHFHQKHAVKKIKKLKVKKLKTT